MTTDGNTVASIRLITDDIGRMVEFYQLVTGLEAHWATEQFAEIRSSTITLAFGTSATLEAFGGRDLAEAASNRSVIVEVVVADVDGEVDRVRAADHTVVVAQQPTTMPWGNRSALLRDPDGGLVNIFCPPAAGRHTPADPNADTSA